MNHLFSPDEFARLLGIATGVIDRHNCTAEEAIELIDRSVRSNAVLPLRSDAEYAEGLRRLRARRNEAIGTDQMRDPAWDMLLDLFVADRAGREMCVKQLCHGAGVPYTTALRHIERLERDGLIERTPHDRDNRRILVRLMPERAARIASVLRLMRNLD